MAEHVLAENGGDVELGDGYTLHTAHLRGVVQTQALARLQGDAQLTDIRWSAYMLATVKHDCAERWQPIEEFGKGVGRAYGVAVDVTDDAGVAHRNQYYGRGYVQITWIDNYRRLGRAIGMGDALVIQPDLALRPQTAYAILSYGMREGAFTGSRLGHYIAADRADYEKARRIVNGVENRNGSPGMRSGSNPCCLPVFPSWRHRCLMLSEVLHTIHNNSPFAVSRKGRLSLSGIMQTSSITVAERACFSRPLKMVMGRNLRPQYASIQCGIPSRRRGLFDRAESARRSAAVQQSRSRTVSRKGFGQRS